MSKPAYIIVKHRHSSEIATIVNQKIAEGYRPIGNISSIGNICFQAMLLDEPSKAQPVTDTTPSEDATDTAFDFADSEETAAPVKRGPGRPPKTST